MAQERTDDHPDVGDKVVHKTCAAVGRVVSRRTSSIKRMPPVISVRVEQDGDDGYHVAGRTIRSSSMFWIRG